MSGYNKLLGKFGEECAVVYLKEKKYKVLEKNYKNIFGEIDIIAKHKKDIVFVEVKTRKSDKFGKPYEAVDYHKQNKIITAAKLYLTQNKLFDKNIRFDVVEVYAAMTDGKAELDKITHIENAISQVKQF